jgi:hypothetical protein
MLVWRSSVLLMREGVDALYLRMFSSAIGSLNLHMQVLAEVELRSAGGGERR